MTGNIYMRILKSSPTNDYLKTLLYVFKNQMGLGKAVLHLTIKYRDGERETTKGKLDDVFKSWEASSLDYGDCLLLEHGHSIIDINNHNAVSIGFNYNSELHKSAKKWDVGVHFILPKDDVLDYFIIKDSPMYHYRLNGYDIISSKMMGKSADVINNAYGKIQHYMGIMNKTTLR